MAEISDAELQKLATLSRLRFEGSTLDGFRTQFDNILWLISQLKELNTEGVPPLTSTANLPSTPEREDKVTSSNNREALQKSAVKAEHGFYVVPKVVE
ncbi:MAG: Asp-tRNA(Asn)/Glu-tRNA(Gln) amidotransferase subunit GatC [Alphaproteobacteria bacterium]|nr:Asp-tRNA(Asn)/Glu-tRNA(Gln) amidotransferase subunit GatC [Alphaproteobacteria bacterium]